LEADEQEIKIILKLWPRMFNSLSTDPDHRVREATYAAHKQLAKKAGRNLAPYLKYLTGPWFVGQFDTFAPAASAARSAFKVIKKTFVKNYIKLKLFYIFRRPFQVQNTRKQSNTAKLR